MAIGKQIRILHASTVAPTRLDRPAGVNLCMTFFATSGGSFRYNPSTGSGDPRCTCASACFLIWAAGYGREGNVLGVHRMRWEDFNFQSTTQATDMYNAAIREVSLYLQGMDTPDYVIRMSTVTPSSSIHFLSQSELAPMLGLPPGIEEMKSSKCGQRPQNGDPGGVYLNCTQRIYEEDSRIGASAFMQVYGSGL
jgi:hypothetical protein